MGFMEVGVRSDIDYLTVAALGGAVCGGMASGSPGEDGQLTNASRPSPLGRGREGEGGGGVLPPSASPAWPPAMRRALARAVMTPLALAAEHCAAGWQWFSLQIQTAGQCLLSLPPCEGRGMGVATPPPILSGHPRGGRTREGKGPYRVGHVPAPPPAGELCAEVSVCLSQVKDARRRTPSNCLLPQPAMRVTCYCLALRQCRLPLMCAATEWLRSNVLARL